MAKELNRISVKGYKSIRELEDLELRSLNVLIGANGSGKTNFISLFTLLRQIVEENLEFHVAQSGGADTFLYFGQKTTDEITVDLAFGRNGYYCGLVPAAGDTLIFGNEECRYHGSEYERPFEVSLGSGHKETHLYRESRQRTEMSIVDHVLYAMRSWRVYHFHDTSPSAGVKLKGKIDDNRALQPNAANLAAFLYLLQEQHHEDYRKIVNTIRLVAPFFNDFALRPDPLNPSTIKLEWRERGSEDYFDANYLSDGTLRFMCLATLLQQPDMPATILIDEPELGLHPYAITLLASLIRSAATQTQVIVSTQSAPLVNQFGPEDIIVVDREEGQSVFKRLTQADLESWLDDYGMGDLWEKNLLGGATTTTLGTGFSTASPWKRSAKRRSGSSIPASSPGTSHDTGTAKPVKTKAARAGRPGSASSAPTGSSARCCSARTAWTGSTKITMLRRSCIERDHDA